MGQGLNMDIQIVALAAVREVLQRKPIWGPRNEPMMYVMSRCPDRERKIGHLYGTLPWNLSHATQHFRERHCNNN